VLYVDNNKSPTIEGLRITGGDAAGLGGGPPWAGDIGGGVLLGDGTSATISDCWVFDNVADSGGGLWARHSEAVLNGNRVFSNTARASGGGLFLELSDDTLSENTVMSNTADDSGGGLYLMGGAPTLINNVVADNHANGTGSGLAMSEETSLRLLHNTIARNHGGDSSGVAIVDYFGPSACTVALTNTIVADQSVGINIGGSGISTVTVNAILWHNSPITVSQSPTDVVTVQNQHTGDPAFAADGYHLMAGSAAIDEGIDTGITSDLDGQGRPAGAGYDLGADEFWHKICLPLVLRNK
jgi:parallel beta-helix repeat protein